VARFQNCSACLNPRTYWENGHWRQPASAKRLSSPASSAGAPPAIAPLQQASSSPHLPGDTAKCCHQSWNACDIAIGDTPPVMRATWLCRYKSSTLRWPVAAVGAGAPAGLDRAFSSVFSTFPP
jgi:hypothetical protein